MESESDTDGIDFDKINCILYVGACGKGKSNAIKHTILSNALGKKKRLKFGIVFTRTKFNNEYSAYLPDDYIFEGFQEDVLQNYLDNLKKYKEKYGKVPHNFVIFDDLIGLLNLRNGALINFLGTHRHTSTHVLLATQHCNTGSSTLLRELCTHCLAWNSKQYNTIDSLYMNFGQLFDSRETFKVWLKANTNRSVIGHVRSVPNTEPNRANMTRLIASDRTNNLNDC